MANEPRSFMSEMYSAGPRRKKNPSFLNIILLLLLLGGLAWGGSLAWPTVQSWFDATTEKTEALPVATVQDGMPIPLPMQTQTPAEERVTSSTTTDSTSPAKTDIMETSSTTAISTPEASLRPDTTGNIGNIDTSVPDTAPSTLTNDTTPASPLAQSWQEVQRLEKANDQEGLIAQLQKILAAHPSDAHGANALYRLGVAAYQQGQVDEANAFWLRAMKEMPRHAGGQLAALVLADQWWMQEGIEKPNAAPNDAWERIRDAYAVAIGKGPVTHLSNEMRARIVKRLTLLNKELIFSPYPCSKSIFHEVKPREVLDIIARRYGVHYASIAAMNGIRAPYSIRVGQRLKVYPMTSDRTEVIVDKKNLKLTLFLDGIWIKEYDICVGPGQKTPLGTFSVLDKMVNPPWTDPATRQVFRYGDPDNILGTRWMRLNNDGIGIHGTTKPETIPGRVSNGCIRMHNRDVEELYGFTLRLSKVIIVE